MILSSGSGLIINHTGVIVTNAHVVNIAATVPWRTELRVQLQNSDVYVGMVRDVDWKTDIATVKVNPQVGATCTSQTVSPVYVTANCVELCRWWQLSRSLEQRLFRWSFTPQAVGFLVVATRPGSKLSLKPQKKKGSCRKWLWALLLLKRLNKQRTDLRPIFVVFYALF